MAELKQGVFPMRLKDPYADEATQPFWDAALEGKLVGSKCTACGTVLIPPQPYCFACQGESFAWVELPGTGTIFSFTVVRHPLAPQLAPVTPYAAGIVDLDGTQGAGSRLIVNIVDCDPDTLRIGDRVKVIFDPVSDTLAVPRCTPI